MPKTVRDLDLNGYRAKTLAVPAALAAGAADAVRRDYVESRGTHLLTNGSGLMGSNYNFSSFTFDPVETHGGGGSFLKNVAQQGYQSDELIPVDVSRWYRLIGWGKSGDVNGANFNAANKQYFGVALYDIDGNSITPTQACKVPTSTDTTLAVALNPNDTTITLTDATGWYNSTDALQRRMSWWPYTNAKGYTYPDYSYTRNVSASGIWAQGGVSGNVITLAAPWAGPALPAGTKVRNAASGGTYKYIALSAGIVPNAWTRYEGIIGDIITDGIDTVTKFWAGTSFAKALFLVNYHGVADNNIRWSDLALTDLSGRNLEAQTGDLTGTYPAWVVKPLAITDAKVAAANKDGAVGVPSMRTLGTGAQQAAAGNDSRFANTTINVFEQTGDPEVSGSPVGGTQGDIWIDTDASVPTTNDLLVPTGTLLPTAIPVSGTPPTGFLFCDGSPVSRTIYANLFAAIGTAYGVGDGSTTFNLPDMRDRFPVGAGPTMALASKGGASTVTLTEAQLAAHNHDLAPYHVAALTSGNWGIQNVTHGSGSFINAIPYQLSGTFSDYSGGIASAGGGASHENRPPYIAVNYMIKT